MNAPRAITSLQNDRVKAIRALEMRKVRRETGLFVAEGASVILTAREHGWVPETLVVRTDSAGSGRAGDLVDWALERGTEVLEVSEAVLEKLASKENPQTLLAVFRQRWVNPPSPAGLSPETVWLALEEVRDPGNLGTIIRTIDAVGGAGIILVGTCCDPYSRETIRATMGSVFAVPVARSSRAEFLEWRQAWPGDVAGTCLDASSDFRAVAYERPTLVLFGSEGPGLSAELALACTKLVKIPMAGRLDSLNLAVAAGLVLYEVRRSSLRL